jgi:hypothetical protein
LRIAGAEQFATGALQKGFFVETGGEIGHGGGLVLGCNVAVMTSIPRSTRARPRARLCLFI